MQGLVSIEWIIASGGFAVLPRRVSLAGARKRWVIFHAIQVATENEPCASRHGREPALSRFFTRFVL